MPRVQQTVITKTEKEAPEANDNRVPSPEFWQYTQGLSEEEWLRHFVYLYRTEPRRSTGPNPALEKVDRAFTIDDVRLKWGGRQFRAMLFKDNKLICTHDFAIEADPIWGDTQSSGATPSSGSLDAMAQKLLEDQREQIRTLREELKELRSGGIDKKDAMTQVVDLMAEANKKVIEIMGANQIKASGSSSILETIAVLKQLGILDRTASVTPTPQDPLQQLDTLLSVFDKLSERAGSGAGSNNPWVVLAQTVGPKIGEILDRTGRMLSDWRIGNEAITHRALLARGVIPPATAPVAATEMRMAAAPLATVESAQQPLPATAEGMPVLPPDYVKVKIVEMLLNDCTGDEAAFVADQLNPDYAHALAEEMKRNPKALQEDPIFSRVLGHPQLVKFVKDFLSYFEEQEVNLPPTATS